MRDYWSIEDILTEEEVIPAFTMYDMWHVCDLTEKIKIMTLNRGKDDKEKDENDPRQPKYLTPDLIVSLQLCVPFFAKTFFSVIVIQLQ